MVITTKNKNNKNKNIKNNNKKLPNELRKWVIQQMVAINIGVLPAELANEFFKFIKESEKKGFAQELASCLSEAKIITNKINNKE